MHNNKTFCIKPFTATCVRTDGAITLCCKSIEQSQHNLKSSSIDGWWSSDFVKEVRTQLLNGQQPASCQICFDQEKSGITSLRQTINADYKIFGQYAEKTLRYLGYPTHLPGDVELQLTNLCNLKCLMCSETESSSILSENKILKINKKNIEIHIRKKYKIIKNNIMIRIKILF